MKNEVKQFFAKKWKLKEQAIFTIYRMIQDSDGQYGKASRALKKYRIALSPRQLKRFYRKANET